MRYGKLHGLNLIYINNRTAELAACVAVNRQVGRHTEPALHEISAGAGGISHGGQAMRTILAAAVLAALALPASAKDDPHGPQWHLMDHSADMRLPIRPWCVPHSPQWATCAHKGTDWKGSWTIK